jgi:hypothetical protein
VSGYRGELPSGKDRQAPVEDPYQQQPVAPQTSWSDGYTWADVIEQEIRMGRRFTVIDSFTSEALKSEYVAGMSYEARDGDTLLLEMIPKWIEQGLVREGGPASEVSGSDAPEQSKE